MTALAVTPPTLAAGAAVPTGPERLLLGLSTRVIASIDRRMRQRSRAVRSDHALAHDEATSIASAIRSTGVLPR